MLLLGGGPTERRRGGWQQPQGEEEEDDIHCVHGSPLLLFSHLRSQARVPSPLLRQVLILVVPIAMAVAELHTVIRLPGDPAECIELRGPLMPTPASPSASLSPIKRGKTYGGGYGGNDPSHHHHCHHSHCSCCCPAVFSTIFFSLSLPTRALP